MNPRFPGEVPRIGAANTTRPPQPQQVNVDTIEVFYQRAQERHEKFRYVAPDDNPDRNHLRAFKVVPQLGLDIEKYDHSHTYIPISAVTKIVLRPAKVPDADIQVAELMSEQERSELHHLQGEPINQEGDSGEES